MPKSILTVTLVGKTGKINVNAADAETYIRKGYKPADDASSAELQKPEKTAQPPEDPGVTVITQQHVDSLTDDQLLDVAQYTDLEDVDNLREAIIGKEVPADIIQ